MTSMLFAITVLRGFYQNYEKEGSCYLSCSWVNNVSGMYIDGKMKVIYV